MNFNLLKEVSWDKKQTLAAKCLEKYCDNYCIKDDSINKLLEHLYSMEKYNSCDEYYNLATWERNGAILELPGRGDPLPKHLEEKIPKEKIQEFNLLVDYTVEVGLCNIYGQQDDKPYEYLIKCINVLEINSIKLPDIIINLLEKNDRDKIF